MPAPWWCGQDPWRNDGDHMSVVFFSPSWPIKAAREGLAECVGGLVNASLQQVRIPTCLKEAIIRALLEKASLNPTIFNSYWQVSNIPFLGIVPGHGFLAPEIRGWSRLSFRSIPIWLQDWFWDGDPFDHFDGWPYTRNGTRRACPRWFCWIGLH